MSTIQDGPTRPEPTPRFGTRSSRHLSVVEEQPAQRAWLGRASKFDPAPIRAGALERERLLRRIAAADGARISLISAPAGYGKSTLARQWCERSQRPAVWINLDRSDNDPVALLGSIAHALDRLDPIAPELLAGLTALEPRILDFALPAITHEFDRLSPVELILDNAHELTDGGALDVLDLLLDGIRPGTHVTLVTRKELHLPLARRRLTGNLVEVKAEDLAFDPGEISAMAATRGMALSDDALDVLGDRTEGWPAGIALSFQVLEESATAAEVTRTITGDQRQIADYLVEVILDEETEERRQFLLATSVLSELTAQLCDATVGVTNAAEMLAELEAENSFVIALDDHRRSYRYHHLFAELLRWKLERSDPDRARECLSRAAAWYEQDGRNPGEAFRCARECSDFSLAGRVALASVDGLARRGRLEEIRLWLGDCGDEQIESDPRLALAAASVSMRLGEREKAQRYGAAAEAGDLDAPADEALSFRTALARFRAHLADRGVHRMLADAELVRDAEREATTPSFLEASLAAGTASLLLGQPNLAAEELRESLALSRDRPELVHVRIQGLGYLSFAAAQTGDWPTARKTAQESAALSAREGLEHTLPGGISRVARAWVLVHDGDFDRAEAAFSAARRVSHLFRGSRWLQADINIRLAGISLDLGDRSTALEHVDVSRAALVGYEDAGTLTSRLEELEVRISCLTDLHVTPAEIRILPFLPTHLSIKEIAAHLYVSPATVKTHVSSVYEKLDASTRSEAVARMQHLGLHLAGLRLERDPPEGGIPVLELGRQSS